MHFVNYMWVISNHSLCTALKQHHSASSCCLDFSSISVLQNISVSAVGEDDLYPLSLRSTLRKMFCSWKRAFFLHANTSWWFSCGRVICCQGRNNILRLSKWPDNWPLHLSTYVTFLTEYTKRVKCKVVETLLNVMTFMCILFLFLALWKTEKNICFSSLSLTLVYSLQIYFKIC